MQKPIIPQRLRAASKKNEENANTCGLLAAAFIGGTVGSATSFGTGILAMIAAVFFLGYLDHLATKIKGS